MGKVGEDIFGTDFVNSTVQCRNIGIELECARLLGQFTILRQLPSRIDFANRCAVPLDFQGIATLLGWPVTIGQHRNQLAPPHAGHTKHCTHTLDGFGCRIVHRLNLASIHRRMRHNRGQHTRQMHVDAVRLSAAGLGACIEPSRGMTDDAKVFGVLELHLLRNRHLHGLIRQFAIAQLLAPRPDHLPCLSAQGLRVYTPALGSRGQQHGAGSRPQFTILDIRVLDGSGAAREMHSHDRIQICGIGIAVRALHLGPIGVQLFGQHHGQAGLHALAELQTVDGDRHRSITINLHKSRWLLVRLECVCRNLFVTLRLCRHSRGKYTQRKTRGRRQLEEIAPLEL